MSSAFSYFGGLTCPTRSFLKSFVCGGNCFISSMVREMALIAPTHIDKFRIVSLSQVVKHSGVVEVCQVSHVLDFFEFRRVYL